MKNTEPEIIRLDSRRGNQREDRRRYSECSTKEIDKIRVIRKRKNWKVAATFSNRFTWSLTWNSCLFQSIFQRTKMTPQQNIILHYITKYRNTIRKHCHRNLYKGTLHEIPASLNGKTLGTNTSCSFITLQCPL